MMGPATRTPRGSFLPGRILYGGSGTSSGSPNATDRGGDYPVGHMQGDGYGYDNSWNPSSGGSGSRNSAGGTGNDAGWSTGIQNALLGAQDDPWKGRLRDRIAPYIRYGSYDGYGGLQGMPGAYAP